MAISRVPVLVLAGSRLGEKDLLAKAGNVSHKSLLPVGGAPMIERVLCALEKSEAVSEIYISSEKKFSLGDSNFSKEVTFLPAFPTLADTVLQATEKIGFPLLIVTSDHALLRPEWVKEFFLKSVSLLNADVAVAVSPKKRVESISETPRTYISLSDIQFSGCNLFFLRSSKAKNLILLWKKIYHLRKSPLRMVRILGPLFLIKAIFKKLSSSELLNRIKILTGVSLHFIFLEDGRAAIDVDSISDWKFVEALLAKEKT